LEVSLLKANLERVRGALSLEAWRLKEVSFVLAQRRLLDEWEEAAGQAVSAASGRESFSERVSL